MMVINEMIGVVIVDTVHIIVIGHQKTLAQRT
jgi:hypothetical protein